MSFFSSEPDPLNYAKEAAAALDKTEDRMRTAVQLASARGEMGSYAPLMAVGALASGFVTAAVGGYAMNHGFKKAEPFIEQIEHAEDGVMVQNHKLIKQFQGAKDKDLFKEYISEIKEATDTAVQELRGSSKTERTPEFVTEVCDKWAGRITEKQQEISEKLASRRSQEEMSKSFHAQGAGEEATVSHRV